MGNKESSSATLKTSNQDEVSNHRSNEQHGGRYLTRGPSEPPETPGPIIGEPSAKEIAEQKFRMEAVRSKVADQPQPELVAEVRPSMAAPSQTQFDQFILNGVRVSNHVLGVGSYASVLALEYMGLKCAGKQIHEVLLEQGGANHALRRFVEECRLLSQVRHPNIVQFLGVHFQPESTTPMLVLEFLPTNLTSTIDQYGILPEDINYSILHDVSVGLCYLHIQTPSIIHRDLTANNILLTPNMTAKISDLGMARIINLFPLQKSGMTQTPGTPAYMPPEVMIARPRYDKSIDVFSFGILMIHVLSGRWPEPQVGQIRIDSEEDKLIPVTEAERREEFLRAIGNTHPLIDLILMCINNDPTRRAHASDITERLVEMKMKCPTPYSNKLEMLRHIQSQNEQIQLLREDVLQRNIQGAHVFSEVAISNQLVGPIREPQEQDKQDQSVDNFPSQYMKSESATATSVGHDVAADNTQLMKLLRQKDDNLKEIIAEKNKFEKLLDNSVKEITNKDFEIKHLQEMLERQKDDSLRYQQGLIRSHDCDSTTEVMQGVPATLRPFIKDVTCLKEDLGSGAYGQVSVVMTRRGKYAAKRFKPELASHVNIYKKFVTEFDILQKLHHKNIVRYCGLSCLYDKEPPLLLMELMTTSVYDKLKKRGGLSQSQKVFILRDVAEGLKYLHGCNPVILHRDLTAKNVLLDSDNNAKIADFGNARVLSDLKEDYLTAFPGTLVYSAPEVYRQKSDEKKVTYNESCDIFSYGHLLLVILTDASMEAISASAVHDEDTGLMKGYTEVQRRELHFKYVQSESKGFITDQLLLLAKYCLSNIAKKRPSADVIIESYLPPVTKHASETETDMSPVDKHASSTDIPASSIDTCTDSSHSSIL